MATIQDVQKKIDTKFKTLKLLEKGTPRIYECNKDSELIKQKQLYEKGTGQFPPRTTTPQLIAPRTIPPQANYPLCQFSPGQ